MDAKQLKELLLEKEAYGRCYICNKPYAHIHHCIYGTANRKKSEKYGLIIPLCMEHHIGPKGVHFNKELDIEIKQMAQRHFEEHFGTREDFIKEFGRSYIYE